MTDLSATGAQPKLDIGKPHPARRYDYWLGGKDNFAADRESADAIAAAFPPVRIAARENRKFLRRVVSNLVGEQGIRQFLDIGTGIPTSPNTHEVAQDIDPTARVVYVDNDPVVLCHARALLTSDPRGRTAYIDADLHHPRRILEDPALRTTLDMNQPIGLLLVAVLHFIAEDDTAGEILRVLVDALAPGSYLAITHATYDPLPDAVRRTLHQEVAKPGAQHGTFRPRTRHQLAGLLDGLGLEPVEPGLVSTVQWHPELPPAPEAGITDADAACYAYVARRP